MLVSVCIWSKYIWLVVFNVLAECTWVMFSSNVCNLQPSNLLDHFSLTAVTFTEEEKEQLRKFTNCPYLLDKTSRYQAWLILVDVLLAYLYEVRSTEGEHNVSVWIYVWRDTIPPEQCLSLDDKILYLHILCPYPPSYILVKTLKIIRRFQS